MAGEEKTEGQQPGEEERLQKIVDDRLNKQLAVFSKALIDKLDSFSTQQSKKLDLKLQETTTQIVDYMMPKVVETAKGVVEANFKALGDQMKERQAAAVVPVQPPPLEQPPAGGGVPVPSNPLSGLLVGLGNMLSTATFKDVVGLVQAIRGTPGVGNQTAEEVIRGFKIAKLFSNLDVAKNDVASFTKLAHEALDTVPAKT